MIFTWKTLNTHDHITIHLNESTVAIPGETLIATRLGQSLHGLIVQTKVQDGIHHTRHRVTGP